MSHVRMMALLFLMSCWSSFAAGQAAQSAKPKLVEVTKIWDKGKHNAFTDLIRWRDKWYCVFREAEGHVGGDGKLRVLESADGKSWQPVGLVEEEGIDLRDPHLSITPDDRLMVVGGGSVYRGTKTLIGRQPRVAFSKDARQWTAPQRVAAEDEWLWRVTWHDGKAYGVAYNAAARQTKDAKEAAKETKPVGADPADWKLRLVVSKDGVKFDTITHLGVPGHPNETTLRFLPSGEMLAMVRREGGSTMGWIGASKSPYTEWKWHETGHRFGGPNFIRLPDGSLMASSRLYPKGPKTVLARMTPTSYEPVLELPSGGDTSYAGMVFHDGVLWVSYYSSHEGKSSIYLAKVQLPAAVCDIGSRRELFVDDYLIDRLQGAELKMHKPAAQEVALVCDAPWEGNTSAYFTVFADGDRFRMIYRGAHFDEKTKAAAHPEFTCYAESKDGVRFEKPKLGLFDFGGSKENNIIWAGAGTHNFTPFKDGNPKCPDEAHYKALAGGRGGLKAYQSPDGIHWSLMREKPVITDGAFDSQNLAFWDGARGEYRAYWRYFTRPGGHRAIRTATSRDFLHWENQADLTYGDAPAEHLYTNAVQPYFRAPHLYVGFPTRFQPKHQQVEPILMTSRDGVQFKRWPEPLIPITAPQDRDGNRSNYMVSGLLQLPGKPNEMSVYATEAYYTGPGSRVRRFTLRTDGFVSVHAGAAGEMLTRPLRFTGKTLFINHATKDQGTVRVEIQDAAGKSIPGYTLADCRPMTGDAIDQQVCWARGNDLSSLAGQTVRLRFALREADLYALQVK